MFDTPPGIVVCDASFISLKLILPNVLPLAARDASLVALIKPQFEAGRDNIGKGGIVRDEAVHARVCDEIVALVRQLAGAWKAFVPRPSKAATAIRNFSCAQRSARRRDEQ